jgi:hypothetical protein
MPKYAKKKDQEYEPILFDLDGKEYAVIEKITAKEVTRLSELNSVITRKAKENVENTYRQLAIYAGKKEDFFFNLMDKIDHRDVVDLLIWVDTEAQNRTVKKKKNK